MKEKNPNRIVLSKSEIMKRAKQLNKEGGKDAKEVERLFNQMGRVMDDFDGEYGLTVHTTETEKSLRSEDGAVLISIHKGDRLKISETVVRDHKEAKEMFNEKMAQAIAGVMNDE